MSLANLAIGLLAFSITAFIIASFGSGSSNSCMVLITGERALVTGCEVTPELTNLVQQLKPHSHSLGF
uniref:Movement protein TGBp3 n=1 Tax=Cherry green ring mottle virus TaxID=65467 RepID=K4HRS7_9VIRU|nr:triple gene block protein 3 [Cherry green ring mottle virus]AHJ80258.1 triple gene block protein 3 [Cherry green ring mottle virus]ALP45846.1 triple gene block protein 3 [Cherry green ring mottle virus]ALP45850.1 triple gene block protein 3 [Cherry green ring mottle virus]ALP45870.1 triple gene block protein 3 [Cherry green ring mottle virus]